MLLSELKERERRFKLALRAGIPVLLLVGLVLYVIFLKGEALRFTTENYLLLGAVIFISIYFIYFLLEQDAVETLLDHETHGFNQKAFEKRLNTSQPKTIALLIVNNLASINENYGSCETNRLLFCMIQRLNYSLKVDGLGNAIIGRRHGAEFFIAANENPDNLKISLTHFFSENSSINNIDVDYRFSLAVYKHETIEKVASYLKDQLVSIKEHGGSSVSGKAQSIADISKIEKEVIASIKKESLAFLFRPLFNIKSGEMDIYKATIRLKSSTGKDILPKTYLPIINRLGLGREYDLLIAGHLIELLPLLDKHISLAFSISPFSLRNKEFRTEIFELINNSGIDAYRLVIELYERKTHHDLGNYFQTLGYMRSKGIRISIDNFGSSNASIEYMKHFRFDMVQFDRDYVKKLNDENTYKMFQSLIGMAKKMDIVTIAKWVDTEEQRNKLKQLDIDYMQGFGIGKEFSEKELIHRYN